MVEHGPTRTVEERGEMRLRMMMRKMKANVMRNATSRPRRIILLCLIIKTFYFNFIYGTTTTPTCEWKNIYNHNNNKIKSYKVQHLIVQS